ncbi:MAG: hypothetical protein LUD51_03880 [Clostridia bacterium]|nr:hypothetical protein [Clostridia bacterium]
MKTIKVTRNEDNVNIFNSIAELLENEDANARKTGTARFYERLSQNGTQYVIDAKRSDRNRIVFSMPGEAEDIAYELDNDTRRGEDAAVFTASGASWFANLREGNAEPMESPDSDWAERRDRIADAYHRKYFTIEYVIDQDMDEREARDCAKDLVGVIGELIYNDSDESPDAAALRAANGTKSASPQAKPNGLLTLKLGSQTGTPDLYYCAKLKVNVSFGVGQPIPVIGRIYYRYEGRTDSKSYGYTMLTREQAYVVDTCLNDISETREETPVRDLNQGAISSTLKTRLETDLNAPDGAERFSDCFLFSEKSMEVLMEHKKDGEIQGDGSTVTLSLECKSIELISVSRIMWSNLLYTALYAGREAFSINYSITGTTMRCLSCRGDCREGEDTLIRGNYIAFPESTGLNGRYCVYSVNEDGSLDKSPEGIRQAFSRFMSATMRVDGKTVSVYSLSYFAKHLSLTPTCREARDKWSGCQGLKICGCQRLPGLRQDVCLCRKCAHPENVYLNADDPMSAMDRYVATSTLFFDAAEGRMRTKVSDKNYECRICGRFYDGSRDVYRDKSPDLRRVGPNGLPMNICPTCRKALGQGTAEEQKESLELFKKYKGILSLGARIAALRAKHGCAENERYIMFRVGTSMYQFDKLLVTDTGYIKGAEKKPVPADTYEA